MVYSSLQQLHTAQVEINWESEQPYAFVISLQVKDMIRTCEVRSSTMKPGAAKR